MEGFDEIINEFLVESYESLDTLDDDLLALEDAPDDLERLASIFRTVHTIKGTSGFLATIDCFAATAPARRMSSGSSMVSNRC